MTIFAPDTCLCEIELDSSTYAYVNWIKKCKEHAAFEGIDLFNKIKEHNQSFPGMFTSLEIDPAVEAAAEAAGVELRTYATSNNLTSTLAIIDDMDSLKALKIAERNRIKALGEPIKNV